jgi:acyltransferase
MKKRYLFLDMLRAVAVVEMIHGHSLDALLSPVLRTTPFFTTWAHVRGYTAPLFLFASGFAFAVSTLPRLSEYTQITSRTIRRLRRILFIVLVGYLMHLPFFSLHRTILSIGSAAWSAFLNIDILQCIGVSLLFLQAWHLLRPRRYITMGVAFVLALAIPLATPVISEWHVLQAVPEVFRYYIAGSRFPLFPYASYILIGFIIGVLFIGKKQWVRSAIVAGIVCILIAVVLKITGIASTLQVFTTRSAVFIAMTLAFERMEAVWKRLPRPVIFFGQESFLVYVVHVVILYGSVLNKGMAQYFGTVFSYTGVYIEFLWLLTAMVVLAYVWHRTKDEHPTVSRCVKYTLYGVFVILFLIRSY